mmetsp:Transcript_11861/g.25276  ORF Transcript_11861/g.25276 Transcript_11861/m.25276 type:complete len:896 (-) Transcript_11861:106-2793(-)|eukprot:CAMPEP_0183737636 /NCGR_PEP_ID=MMETSP0737-20130205/52505_1 /TAXON_ID=385413 /ORGANISM="Thalassiosira miniscula, Strain CCMP1093" /LENGTH=895 /DNA_ID=CAMNT_0025971963 /DNA_START=212 /DNA_END=2899 /DNA_ORIENTATION=-
MVGSAHPNSHHYAIDAAKLVEKCQSLLHSILDVLESSSSSRAFQRRSFQLATLADALKCVDRLIHTHLLDLLDREMEFLSSINESDAQKKAQLHQFFGEHTEFPTLMDTVKTLKCAERVTRDYRRECRDNMISTGFGDSNRDFNNNPFHRRTHSTPPVVFSGGGALLSVDDPIEEDSSQSWYFGDRRSPSPPPLQSAGDSSPPTSPPTAHRRTLSTGEIKVPALPVACNPTNQSRSNQYAPSRSAKDSSLFRLIVTLQLCLVRIEEANCVLCKGKARASSTASGRSRSESFQSQNSGFFELRNSSSNSNDGIQIPISEESESCQRQLQFSSELGDSSWKKSHLLAMAGIAAGSIFFLTSKSKMTTHDQMKFVKVTGKAAAGVATASFVRKRWRILCMNARVANSADALEDWIFHWICLGNSDGGYKRLLAPRKSIFWYSIASIRFQLMKRGMDLLYASIGKAIEITRGQEVTDISATNAKTSSGLWTYVVASLAASYYNVIGPAAKSAHSLANAPSSVIQNAWGMVSLPAVKKASLEATRILKGAAIADRIEICGISCFVLSQKPFPALASALRRFRRQQEREDIRLGTIHESLSSHSSSVNVKGFQKRNLILHLTGGGFFAHTIAADLPYLLDWSASSEAVVIIPEYALFPHKFPDAIDEITLLYKALRFGQAVTTLGFQADHIVVSGESVGGNLAAALCVSMISAYAEGQCVELSSRKASATVNDCDDATFYRQEGENALMIQAGDRDSEDYMGLELPDALMLCCPALNLALDTSPSRIDGANDPVLPSALITTISNSYLDGCPVTNPVASPYFASDQVLRNFPPTLIFTSSEDPFLDDSVTFNGRLRSVGVKSNLHAVHDLPHAYWGLSTAGIPEARHVQKECQRWLAKVLA